MSIEIPRMMEVRQSYPAAKTLDFPALVADQFAKSGVLARVRPGMRIAVGVGSRGVANLKEITRATVDVLKRAGAEPFVIPAMGSHGGATPEGQRAILAGYGVTEETVGAPIDDRMDVKVIGTALLGDATREVLFSAAALEADAVLPINRVKPHTDFGGPLGSGIQKMLTIGFGKQIGANNAHRLITRQGHEKVIRAFAEVILKTVTVLGGVAVVEDQHHETAELEVLTPETLVRDEERLLRRAWELMPQLPMDEIDLLIVDEIGKEISGAGMDPNVVNRDIMGYSASLMAQGGTKKPHIHRIFVRDLSKATHGNGIGIGQADFTTVRVVKGLDKETTYMNALTSIGIQATKMPMYFDSDREAITEALGTLAPEKDQVLRVVRIKNTLSLDRMLVSEGCAEELKGRAGVSVVGAARAMEFDGNGNLRD
jgi:Domain of unknown function (DUF362)